MMHLRSIQFVCCVRGAVPRLVRPDDEPGQGLAAGKPHGTRRLRLRTRRLRPRRRGPGRREAAAAGDGRCGMSRIVRLADGYKTLADAEAINDWATLVAI